MAKRRGRVLDGVLLLDKPVGLSSNHALQRARRALDAQKAGHTGTLDPFATGLLVCCLGRATKISGAMIYRRTGLGNSGHDHHRCWFILHYFCQKIQTI